jgi:lipoyl(octanoyl) transferase
MRSLPWTWLGRVPYSQGTALQEQVRDRLLAGDPGAECLLLLEHEPVVTLGRSARARHIVAPDELRRQGVQVVRSSRGGDVTYHGPGQLMVYPIVRMESGVMQYLESLAAGLAALAAELGVPGSAWRRNPAGLWLGDAKLAACGLHVRRGVAVHGWAFNVSTPPAAWSWIVPCGLADRRVTSIAEHAFAPSVAEVAVRAARHLCDHLGRKPVETLLPGAALAVG